MTSPSPLEPGLIYHIYNRGTPGENLFQSDGQFEYFLALYARHVVPCCETLAYCLMPNHIHLAIQVRNGANLATEKRNQGRRTSQVLGNLFNAYAKSINCTNKRTGSLFEHPFHRKPVLNDAYLAKLISYIHLNPQRHEFVNDFRLWPWSSYIHLLEADHAWLSRDRVMTAFGDTASFAAAHLVWTECEPVNP